MRSGLNHVREIFRSILGPFLLYVLLVQAIAVPFARAQAADLALSGKGVVLCIPASADSGGTDRRDGTDLPSHGLDCCLPGRWLDLDSPVATLVDAPFHHVVRAAIRLTHTPAPLMRGPPSLHATPGQARAPPISL